MKCLNLEIGKQPLFLTVDKSGRLCLNQALRRQMSSNKQPIAVCVAYDEVTHSIGITESERFPNVGPLIFDQKRGTAKAKRFLYKFNIPFDKAYRYPYVGKHDAWHVFQLEGFKTTEETYSRLNIEDLVIQAKEGSKEAYEYLFKRNMKLARYHAAYWKAMCVEIEFEELYGHALLAMTMAYQGFDIKKHVNFIAYCNAAIRNRIITLVKKYNKNKAFLNKTYSLYTRESGDTTETWLHNLLIHPSSDDIHDKITSMALYDVIAEFRTTATKEQIFILDEIINKGKNPNQLAKELNIHHTYVYRKYKKIVKILRILGNKYGLLHG